MLVYLTAIAIASYLPLILTVAIVARACRSPYAYQTFTDSIKALGGQVTIAAFLLFMPAIFLVLFNEPALADLPWDKQETPLIILAWAAEYPLTLLIYHGLKSRLQKAEPYTLPYPAFANIGLDLLKHGFLLMVFFVAMYAGNQTIHPDKLMVLKRTIESTVGQIYS